jgi:hypothetical protein
MFHGENTSFSERDFTVGIARRSLIDMLRTLAGQKSANPGECSPSSADEDKSDLPTYLLSIA